MSNYPMKYYYMGEDVDTLSRERLIEIIGELGKQLDATRANAISSTKLMGDIARAAARSRSP